MLHRRCDEQAGELSLIFTRTKHGAKNLAKKINAEGLKADAIHGNKSQSAREKTLERYRQGEIDILVATDVAARGIDVKNITLVVNYDLPMEPDAYVHRIGRTASGRSQRSRGQLLQRGGSRLAAPSGTPDPQASPGRYRACLS